MNIKELLTKLGYTSNDPDENVRNALEELIELKDQFELTERNREDTPWPGTIWPLE